MSEPSSSTARSKPEFRFPTDRSGWSRTTDLTIMTGANSENGAFRRRRRPRQRGCGCLI